MELFKQIVNHFQLFLEKNFIIDVRLGSKYASEKTETFKMKLWLAKSSRLLQRAAFLVLFQLHTLLTSIKKIFEFFICFGKYGLIYNCTYHGLIRKLC